MSELLFPIGYGRRLGTIDEVMAYMEPDWIEPEYAERIRAWFLSRDGELGPGGAMRLVQPQRPGFAPGNMTFHLRQFFNDREYKYMACDLVHRNGDDVHRAPRWDEVPRQGSGHRDISLYGVHCNVNGEPWHMQCIEIDGYLSWVNEGRQHPNPNFIIASGGSPYIPPDNPPPQPSEPTYPVPPGSFTVPTLTSLRRGAPNNAAHTQVAQSQLNRWVGYAGYAGGIIPEDGQFGDVTHLATVLFQRAMGITDDGVIGPQTWDKLYSDC